IRCGSAWRLAPASGSPAPSSARRACPATIVRARWPLEQHFQSSALRLSARSSANIITAGSWFIDGRDPGSSQLLLEDGLVDVVANRAEHQSPVDEDCRGSRDAERVARRQAVGYRRPVPLRLDARIELAHVEAGVFRVPTQAG